jgi:hypothetical protein
MYFALRPILGFALVLLRSETTYQVEPPARPPALRREIAVLGRQVERSALKGTGDDLPSDRLCSEATTLRQGDTRRILGWPPFEDVHARGGL